MTYRFSTTLISILCYFATLSAQHSPTFEEILSLSSISNPEISPDGNHVLYQVQSTDWKNNRYDREIWISKNGATPFQLTNHPESNSTNAKWSPDGLWISFVTSVGDQSQIHVMRAAGGAAFQLTHTKNGVNNYECEDKKDKLEARKEKYGGYSVEDEEYNLRQLWKIEFHPNRLNALPTPQLMEDSIYKSKTDAHLLIDSVDFTINDFQWSPDGTQMAIEHQPDPLINSFFNADISIYDIATKELRTLVQNESYDGLIDWSPDGGSILYTSSVDNRTSNYYENGRLFRINTDGTGFSELATGLDEDISRVSWVGDHIYVVAWQKTKRNLYDIDPNSGAVTKLSNSVDKFYDYSFAQDGRSIAYTGAQEDGLTELYMSTGPEVSATKVTSSSDQLSDWSVSNSAMISWQSEDGTTIEGVLHKPQDYDPNKKYPLMVIIHGGPTGISTPSPAPSYVYPVVQWLNKGALVLQPNYRGSAGYGEAFRSLNVKNLGVGDAWDVLSGVQHLKELGLIDSDKIGCMGWSQGGYISAFLTTNSDKFKAISVGAGISNWMTYYVNTDIHPFTRQYLKATPWSDKAIYEKTSPMTNINDAVTPTLIQHGEFDRRVPIANAYELYQGLQDVGVETELIVYKGFGHGISKPKERLAATWHNWKWFAQYIWGEEVELPE